MHVLVTGKNEEDPIKNESQHFFHYKSMVIFPDAKGLLTPQSLVQSGQIFKSFEMFCRSLLPARIKKNPSKLNTRVFAILSWELPVAMERRVLIGSDANEAFPQPR